MLISEPPFKSTLMPCTTAMPRLSTKCGIRKGSCLGSALGGML